MNEAYEVLNDPEARARYDTLEYAAEEKEDRASPPSPIVCSDCGKVTAQPRYVVYRYVVSLFVTTIRTPIQGIFCADCGQKAALKASAITAFAGWWGIPWGPIFTVGEIFRNAFGGFEPEGSKQRLLWINALAFLGIGELRLSYALAKEARSCGNGEIAEGAQNLINFLKNQGVSEVPPLVDRWKMSPGRVAIHLGLLAALPLTIFLFSQSYEKPPSPSAIWQTTSPPPLESSDSFGDATASPPLPSVPTPTCFVVPETGAVLENNANWVERGNALEIKNGSGGNAIIKIKDPTSGRLLVSFFVSKNSTARFSAIPDGSYTIQYGFGEALDEACTKFVKLDGAGEFPGNGDFKTTDDGEYLSRTVLSFTLYSVPNGNITPTSIDASKFDAN